MLLQLRSVAKKNALSVKPLECQWRGFQVSIIIVGICTCNVCEFIAGFTNCSILVCFLYNKSFLSEP